MNKLLTNYFKEFDKNFFVFEIFHLKLIFKYLFIHVRRNFLTITIELSHRAKNRMATDKGNSHSRRLCLSCELGPINIDKMFRQLTNYKLFTSLSTVYVNVESSILNCSSTTTKKKFMKYGSLLRSIEKQRSNKKFKNCTILWFKMFPTFCRFVTKVNSYQMN